MRSATFETMARWQLLVSPSSFPWRVDIASCRLRAYHAIAAPSRRWILLFLPLRFSSLLFSSLLFSSPFCSSLLLSALLFASRLWKSNYRLDGRRAWMDQAIPPSFSDVIKGGMCCGPGWTRSSYRLRGGMGGGPRWISPSHLALLIPTPPLGVAA